MEISKPGILDRIDKVDHANLKVIDSVLREAGYEIYIVGGCVRDLLLGRIPDEFDLTTNARPEKVQSLFKKVIPTGLQHGTVTVLLKKRHYEITTYRSEAGYSDGRRPDAIQYEDNLEADISRRDFTINGLAYDVSSETVFDHCGGVEDLDAKIIRAIGNPVDRFTEDGLRPVRALRFQVKLDFTIESDTFAAVDKTLDVTAKVAVERFFDEFYKILAHPHWPDFVDAVRTKGIWKLFVKSPWPEHSYPSADLQKWSYDQAAHVVTGSSVEIKQAMEAVYYYAVYGPSILKEYSGRPVPASGWTELKLFRRELKNLRKQAADFFEGLKRPNQVREIFLSLIEAEIVFSVFHLDADKPVHQRLLQAFIQSGSQALISRQLACYYLPEADLALREPFFHFLRSCPDEAVPGSAADEAQSLVPAGKVPLRLGQLSISGNDIRALGVQGSEIGHLLDLAMGWVLVEPSINKKETLLKRMQSEL